MLLISASTTGTASAFDLFDRIGDCFSVDRIREIRCMINSNLHIGRRTLAFTVNDETIQSVRSRLDNSDIEPLVNLLSDKDSRIVFASQRLLVEFGEQAYLELVSNLRSTDPLLNPGKRKALQNAYEHFHQYGRGQFPKLDITYPVVEASKDSNPGQRLSKPYSPDDRGLLRIDENMFKLSTATGGLYYFWAPGEFRTAPGATVHLGKKLAYQFGDSSEKPLLSPLTIPVEASTSKLYLFSGAQKIEHVRLLTPDGLAVDEIDNKSTLTLYPLKYMYIAQIDNPQPGRWHLEFSGQGKYILSAQGR